MFDNLPAIAIDVNVNQSILCGWLAGNCTAQNSDRQPVPPTQK
jgi:hypothetical protein